MKGTTLAVSAVIAVTTLAMPSPASAEPTESAGGAVQQFGACLSARKSGDLLLLIDRSGSFGYTVRVLPRHSALASRAELGLIVNA